MFDISDIDELRENNRIEAKKAAGGLPESLWQTYSAFANTFGGYILLGVTENKDHSFDISGLSAPETLVQNFWNTINNPNKVSINILSDNCVTVKDINGKRIIVIEVPRAPRQYKPVYIDGNPVSGTYRRNGEGDYHCTDAELRALYRDASIKSQDMLVLEKMDCSVFCEESIKAYRQRMKFSHPGHVWEKLDNVSFLQKLGAMALGEDGKPHPTAAGILMFGYEYEIVREYPQFFLDYREEYDDIHRWTDRIVSSSGDWSGNLFDFYFRVYNRLQLDVKIPFEIKDGFRIDDTQVHKGLREALANCLINADYYGPRGVVIIKKRDQISLANPGNFRIDLREAESGGTSDPRNATIMKMFTLIDIGERAGSGIPNILNVWANQGWSAPIITEYCTPSRVILSLPIANIGDKINDEEIGDKSALNIGDKINDEEIGDKSAINIGDKINDGEIGDKSAIKIGDKINGEEIGDKSAIKIGDKINDGEIGDKINGEEIGDKSAINIGDKSAITGSAKTDILKYLSDHSPAKTADISKCIGLSASRTRDYLKELISLGIVLSEGGGNRNRRYRLK